MPKDFSPETTQVFRHQGRGATWVTRQELDQVARQLNVTSQDTDTLMVTNGPDGPTLLVKVPDVDTSYRGPFAGSYSGNTVTIGADRAAAASDYFIVGGTPYSGFTNAGTGGGTLAAPETIVMGASGFVYYDVMLVDRTSGGGTLYLRGSLTSSPTLPVRPNPALVVAGQGALSPTRKGLDTHPRYYIILGYATVAGGVVTDWKQHQYGSVTIDPPPVGLVYWDDQGKRVRCHFYYRQQSPTYKQSFSTAVGGNTATYIHIQWSNLGGAVIQNPATHVGSHWLAAYVETDASGELLWLIDYTRQFMNAVDTDT